MVTEGSEPSEEPASVDASGATVALPDVEAGLGADPGPAAPLTAVVVVVPARPACFVAEVPEDAGPFVAAVAPGPAPLPAAGAPGDAEDPGVPGDSGPATAPAF
jgi:hypothetical protein